MENKTTTFIKKAFKILLCIIAALFILQVLRFEIEKHAFDTSDIDKPAGNYIFDFSEYNMGNCVLVEKENEIGTFPLVFGNRLYLYDIVQDKYKFIAGTWFPFTRIGSLITSSDQKVFYNKVIWEGSDVDGYVYYTDIETYEKGKVPDAASDVMHIESQVYDNKIYYRKTCLEEVEAEDYGTIYVMDLDSGKEDVFMEKDIRWSRLIENKMYCYNKKENELIITNLDTGETSIHSVEHGRLWNICPMGEEVFLWCHRKKETLNVKFNEKDGTETVINNKKHDGISKYRKGKFYSEEDDDRICSYNEDTWEKEPVIDVCETLPFLKELEHYNTISYCDDYIAIEILYYDEKEDKDHSRLLVYDYYGTPVREEQLY